jgi:putative lipase involved disintegration of autophagic bodies
VACDGHQVAAARHHITQDGQVPENMARAVHSRSERDAIHSNYCSRLVLDSWVITLVRLTRE